MPSAGGGEVLGDQAGGVEAQRDGPADGAQSAVVDVAAEDEELWAGQGAGDRADDRLSGVPPPDLRPSPVAGQVAAVQA